MEDLQIKNENGILTPIDLLSQAIDKGVGIDALERLMDLKERYDAKQAEKAFYVAMNQFQANKPKLKKTKVADFGAGKAKYSYNPLAKIQEAIDPVLSRFGLSYKWERQQSESLIRIACIVSHVDGHSESTWLESGPDSSGGKNPLQSIGSARSYLKRYTLEDALGLSSDDDDDGKKSSNGQPVPNANQWIKILEKFKTGEVELDKIKQNFSLTEAQNKEIEKLTK